MGFKAKKSLKQIRHTVIIIFNDATNHKKKLELVTLLVNENEQTKRNMKWKVSSSDYIFSNPFPFHLLLFVKMIIIYTSGQSLF